MNAMTSIILKIDRRAENSSALSFTRGSRVNEISIVTEFDPPTPSFSQYLSLLGTLQADVGDALTELVKSVEDLFGAEGIELGARNVQPFTLRQTELPLYILGYAWKPILEMLEYIFRECTSESHAKQALDNIQRLIRITGSVSLKSGLQKTIESLCAWKTPEATNADLEGWEWRNGHKYTYACRAILDTARSLNALLDEENWLTILKALERLSQCFGRKESAQQQLDSIHYDVIKKVGKSPVECKVEVKAGKELRLDEYGDVPMLSPFPARESTISLSAVMEGNNPPQDLSLEHSKTPKVHPSKEAGELGFTEDAGRLSVGSKRPSKKALEFQAEVETLKDQLDSLFIFTSSFDVF